jgi:putative solute:sodium symporter small subunit
MTARKALGAFLVCVVMVSLGVGIHIFAPTLNGLKVSGLPSGYWMAAQGGPIMLALVFASWLSRKSST